MGDLFEIACKIEIFGVGSEVVVILSSVFEEGVDEWSRVLFDELGELDSLLQH